QTLELAAVCWAFCNWMACRLKVVTDSLYVTGVVQRIEDAALRQTGRPRLVQLFQQLQQALRQRTELYCVIHIRSHQWSLSLGQGNVRADSLVSVGLTVRCPVNKFEAARVAHDQFHQNAKGLARQFKLSHAEATGIVCTCPECSRHGPGIGIGVNPRGLKALEVWQMDVTHVNSFGRLRYVHVTIDTYLHFVWATAQAGEKALHMRRHLTQCVAVMGVPEMIKTDNGPAYTSQSVRKWMMQWGIQHVTGIPHSPTGHAVIERVNRTMKEYISK
ncbi:hypothetical protein N309_01631, partial [Tinamus guttatus]